MPDDSGNAPVGHASKHYVDQRFRDHDKIHYAENRALEAAARAEAQRFAIAAGIGGSVLGVIVGFLLRLL